MGQLDRNSLALLKDKASLFLDSGAFSVFSGADQIVPDSKEFWRKIDSYGQFVKTYQKSLDYYANFDVVGNPELSWKVLKRLETKWGLSPIPVVHFGTNIVWLNRYIDDGYQFIGIGGMVGANEKFVRLWLDQIFNLICNQPSRLPKIRTHGFAITTYGLMIRYPWWSVDSTTWCKAAGYGEIIVPHKRNGDFTFAVNPYRIGISERVPQGFDGRYGTKDMRKLSLSERAIIFEWLDRVQIPLGSDTKKGVVNNRRLRCVANIKFFCALAEWLPKWPWAFTVNYGPGLFD